MPVELPKPDTKPELLLLAVVERLDALLAALAPPADPAPPTPSPRKRAPKRSAEEA
jgi:hypothetical protein